VNPANPSGKTLFLNIQTAAEKSGVSARMFEARSASEIDSAFTSMANQKIPAVIVAQDQLLIQSRRQIATLALKNLMLSISGYLEYVEAGGLLSYGQNLAENYHRAAIFVDKILKGAKAGDIPIEQPTNFDLAINLRSATALGIKIPQSILVQATRLIE
jgi:putative ABC transport system substrate-binding protein